MRVVRAVVTGLLSIVFSLIHSPLVHAQSPAPVENVSSLPPRTAADEQRALHVPPGFEIQLVAS